MPPILETCEKCEELPGDVKCSCGAKFCEGCFANKHLLRNPNHRRGGTAFSEKVWAWINGSTTDLSNAAMRAKQFEKDESTKWFGLHITKVGMDRVTWLIETPRFARLMEESMNLGQVDNQRQFPNFISFVGETGAGKSTIIRSLIKIAAPSIATEDLEVPVSGARSGSSALLATTGEVNLYADPSTLGTKHPRLLVDCEGMLGGEPVAAKHQKEWPNHGKKYVLTSKDGKEIDRRTAVLEIYPRLLYIFSDVVCMITRNQKAWTDSVVKLLNWSLVGAHNTINQYALPALIIVLNGPAIENETWIADDQDVATEAFFTTVEKEIDSNATLREMAKKHGNKTTKELLMRNFSSVYVHYKPLEGFQSLGNSAYILPQIQRLAIRIQTDSSRVLTQRDKTWSQFDGKQYGVVFDYAFKHLATGTDEPFDFSQCREQVTIPSTIQGFFAEFLGWCMHGNVNDNFRAAASILGSCILRHSLKSKGSDLLHPFAIFNKEIKEISRRALEQFLGNNTPCAYVHAQTGHRCVNTKAGHRRGHQAADGSFLAEGSFVKEFFDTDQFLALIEEDIARTIKELNDRVGFNRTERRKFAAMRHQALLKEIPNKAFWKSSFTPKWIEQFNMRFGHIAGASLSPRASVCYACMFGRPEYKLPCGHVICLSCVREFDATPAKEEYPGIARHDQCVMCGSTQNKYGQWPYVVEYRPDLSGIRILSLDGGGVRGILQLITLQRLEQLVGCGLPIGELFDLMVGTSAGGLVALGLGAHNLSVQECIERFKRFCSVGFEKRSLTKGRYLGWVGRLLTPSIYKTQPLEAAFQEMFGEMQLFGNRQGTPCVAVTTTAKSHTQLLANYNQGDQQWYLNSNISTWNAARCTSAAPMYFKVAKCAGIECRDGGLRENNPVQLAVNEARTIWGGDTKLDLIFSIGCGYSRRPPDKPASKFVLKPWLAELFTTLLETMNGKESWERFYASTQQPMRDRCYRLSAQFQDKKEPELDDVNAVNSMERLGKTSKYRHEMSYAPFSPSCGRSKTDKLEVIADSLRASLYFFELTSLTQQDDVSIIKGQICCDLQPNTECYRKLLDNTIGFQVSNRMVTIPNQNAEQRFKLDVSFQQQASQYSEPIRIDVLFKGNQFEEDSHFVSISGFPMSLKVLRIYWDTK